MIKHPITSVINGDLLIKAKGIWNASIAVLLSCVTTLCIPHTHSIEHSKGYWCGDTTRNAGPTFLLSCVTTLCTSHSCSSLSESVTPAFSSRCSSFSSDSCLASSSSKAAGLSGSSSDQRDVAGFRGGTYL